MADEIVETQPAGNMMYYLVGAGVVVAIAAGIYFMRPKQNAPTSTAPVAEEPTPTLPTGPITGLACEQQYYNPVVGFPRYFLGVRGADGVGTKSVDCEFTVSVGGSTVATETATAEFTEAPDRDGQIFNCRTKEIALTKNVPTKVDIKVTNDSENTATCSRVFLLP